MSSAADRVIARAARALAPYFAANGIRWADWANPSQLAVPGEAEIALALKEMVGLVQPGGRIESGHLVIEWPLEDRASNEAVGAGGDVPAPGAIRVLFHLAEIEPEEP